MEKLSYINYVETIDCFKDNYNPNQPFNIREVINYILNVDKTAVFCYNNTKILYVGSSFGHGLFEMWDKHMIWVNAFSYSQILTDGGSIPLDAKTKFYLLYKTNDQYEREDYIHEIIDYSQPYKFNELLNGEIYITSFFTNGDRYMYFPDINVLYKVHEDFVKVEKDDINRYPFYKINTYYKNKPSSQEYIDVHMKLNQK